MSEGEICYPTEVAQAMGEIIRMARGAEDLLRTTDYCDGITHRSLRSALWALERLAAPPSAPLGPEQGTTDPEAPSTTA